MLEISLQVDHQPGTSLFEEKKLFTTLLDLQLASHKYESLYYGNFHAIFYEKETCRFSKHGLFLSLLSWSMLSIMLSWTRRVGLLVGTRAA